jgi:hypothetical protein
MSAETPRSYADQLAISLFRGFAAPIRPEYFHGLLAQLQFALLSLRVERPAEKVPPQ